MNDHADAVRRLTEAVLAFPNMAAADRSELENVLRKVDDVARIFGRDAATPQILGLFAQRMHALIQRVHTIGSKYSKRAS